MQVFCPPPCLEYTIVLTSLFYVEQSFGYSKNLALPRCKNPQLTSLPISHNTIKTNVAYRVAYWVIGSMVRWVEGLLVRWVRGKFDRSLVRWFAGSMDRWFDGCLESSMDRWFDGSLNRWIVGSMDRWFDGLLVRWFVGSMNKMCVGSLVRWIYKHILRHIHE